MYYVEKDTPNGIKGISHYDWRELSNLYQGIVTGQIKVKDSKLQTMVENWRTNENGFYGATSGEIIERIHNGYEFEQTIDPENLPDIAFEVPRMRYTDDPEGEFNNDLYSMGETEFFLTKPKVLSAGGLRLKLNYNFNANSRSNLIAEYAQWIGMVIQSLQARGYDLEIDVFFQGRNTYAGQAEAEHTLRLSNFGERVMPFDWSALFSPGGFRHFTFLMILWTGEVENGVENTHGMGTGLGPKFDIEWEPRERIIEVTCDSNASTFPAKEMTDRFNSWRE